MKHSALAVVAPPPLAAVLDEVREKYDPAYPRWPPHINMIYGFLPEADFDVALAAAQSVTESFGPFVVELGGFEVFEHGRSASLVMTPKSSTELIELQRQLQELFPDCSEQSRHAGGFHPHLTVGKFSSAAEANKLKVRVQTLSNGMGFQKHPFVHNSVCSQFLRRVRNFGRMFAILFEVLLTEIQEEIHHFAGWEGGVTGRNNCEQTGVS